MFRHASIKRKLMAVILLTSGAVLVLACGIFFVYELLTFRQTMVRDLSTIGQVVAANSTAALAFDNRADATDVLSALSAERHIIAAGLYDNSGTLFARYPDVTPDGELPALLARDGSQFAPAHLVVQEPVVNVNRRLGTLVVKSDLGALYQRLSLYGGLIAAATVLCCLVAFPLSNRLQRHISVPVLALSDTAKVVSERQDYSVRAAKFAEDELGRLVDAFNDMLAQIQRQDAALRQRQEDLHREVAERVRAEQEVRALNASLERRVQQRTHDLEEANRELEAFSYSVSHDLRAPLRHIHGYVDMLKRSVDGQLSEKSRRYLETIAAASRDMGVLIDDLLSFSRMGRAELRQEAVNLNDLVRECLTAMDDSVRGRRIEWTLPTLPRVVGDRAMLKQVLVNLLDNAVKYTRPRDPARIEIGCAGTEDDRAVLFVRDNGVGFDPNYTTKLFGVFQRLHRADEFEGTGIGLATVRRIISRHSGRTWAEGELDKGTAIFFTLETKEAAHPAGAVRA